MSSGKLSDVRDKYPPRVTVEIIESNKELRDWVLKVIEMRESGETSITLKQLSEEVGSYLGIKGCSEATIRRFGEKCQREKAKS